MNGVEQLTGRKVGDAITMRVHIVSDSPRYYGRLLRFAGDEYAGEFPMIVLITPGGSTVGPAGIAYVEGIADDHPDLVKWEKHGYGRPVYDGKLIRSPAGWIEAPPD